jgi:hypothetical protein
MITVQHTCEALSRAHVQAIAGSAGANLTRLSVSTFELDYGVDGTFHEVRTFGGRHINSGFPLDFQLKASTLWTIEDDRVVYDLEAKTFNDLVDRSETERATPCILVLLCLPRESADWVTSSEDALILRKCCYWHHLAGTATKNRRTVRIRIPRAHLFGPESLTNLLLQVRRGELRAFPS